MIVWHSIYLEVAYGFLGWMSFLCWSLCFYPQVLLNYRRASVVGLNFDFPVLNLTKHTSYLIYNAAMYFSPEVQSQYHDKYGPDQMIPVGLNDILFSMHAVSLTVCTVIQIFIYERGDQRISKTCTATTAIIWVYALYSVIVAWPKHSWLWLITIFNNIQVIITTVKYIPQEVIFFDLLFIFQHYVLYPEKKNNKILSSPAEKEPFLGASGILADKGGRSRDRLLY